MPLARYFLFVGGALLALLFAVNSAMPPLPAAESPPSAGTDLSVIRIQSDKKWPERIVFDTTRPTIAPNPTLASQMMQAPRPPKVAAVEPANGQAREAFAQVRADANEARSPAPRRKYRAVAKNYAPRNYAGQPPINYGAPRPFMVAQQPRFGFFGSNVW